MLRMPRRRGSASQEKTGAGTTAAAVGAAVAAIAAITVIAAVAIVVTIAAERQGV